MKDNDEKQTIKDPHDSLAFTIISQKSEMISLVKSYLPRRINELLDPKTFCLEPGTFIDERFKRARTDVLYSVKLAGRDAFIYTVLEHQSTHDKFMAHRLLKYIWRITDRYIRNNPNANKIPMVLPILLSQVKGGWKAAKSFIDLIDLVPELKPTFKPYIPDFSYELIDLGTIDFHDLKGNLIIRILQYLLKAQGEGSMHRWVEPEFLNLFSKILETESTAEIFKLYMKHCLDADSKLDYQQLSNKLDSLEDNKLKQNIMSIAEEIRTEGKAEGKAEGELIGQIVTYQSFLNEHTYSQEDLESYDIEKLKEILAQLEKKRAK